RGDLTAVSAHDAFAEVLRQHQLWESYRGQVASAPAAQPVGAPAGGQPAAGATRGADGSRLELVAPGGADGGGAPGGASGGAGSDLLREEIDARSQQNADLESKLTEAEEIIDILQRQVNIKDEELAALQARLAELGIDHGDITAAAHEATGVASEGTADEGGADVTAEAGDAEAAAEEMPPGMDEDESAVAGGPGDEAGMVEEPAGEPEEEIVVADESTIVVPPPPARSFPANLVPEHIAAMVPGGSLTVLGGAAALILGLFVAVIVTLARRRGGAESVSPTAAPAAAAATVTAATAVPIEPEEDDETASEAPTEIGGESSAAATEFDPSATIEAEAEEEPVTDVPVVTPPPAQDEEDPLEEVNVYLAYERFDQAEELVKRVIEQYPDRHEYKLRLLEVYYSSNDRAAYEAAARQLHEAVGEDDTLWPSAVAMWTEMSPERELFAAGGDAAATASAPQEGKAFVDITGDSGAAEEVGADTVAQVPGGDDDGLDFDLGADGAGEDDSGVLDLTASAGEDDVLDLTASADADEALDLTASAEDEDVFDITAGNDEADEGALELPAEVDDGVLDITDADDFDDGGMLDLTAAADDDEEVLDLTGGDAAEPAGAADDEVLDITAGEAELLEIGSSTAGGVLDLESLEDTHAGGSDLLDVTRTGDISSVEDDDLLNVTSPGMRAPDGLVPSDADDDAGTLDIVGGDSEGEGLDFDISESVAPAFEADSGDEDVLDLTDGGATSEGGGGDLIDFDIGGLADEGGDEPLPALDTEATTTVDDDTVDMAKAIDAGGEEGSELDFDLGIGDDSELAGDGLSVEESEDDDGRLEITLSALDTPGAEGDLSLQGDALDELALDTPDSEVSEFDIALDGTVDMESIAGEETVDMASVSLDAAGDDESELEALEIEAVDDEAHLDTVSLEVEQPMDLELEDERTVILPVDEDTERQSDSDEADTKLNLAKAYIELGDTEGARSILDEVVNDGNEAQKSEAQALLGQLPD
ncbi:MAG: hypothetical protein KDK06_00250, partial [Gammaproteobacteria bacterium]|nr:hypothetical protein [Gammaproteobacteria bacterium]